MENSHTFVRSPSPRPPYEYSSPVLFSLLLCFAVKQSCNVRRLPSILIESAVMDEPKQLPRDGRLRRREKNSSVSGLPRTTALDSVNDSSISLSDPVPLSSGGFLIKFAPLIGFKGSGVSGTGPVRGCGCCPGSPTVCEEHILLIYFHFHAGRNREKKGHLPQVISRNDKYRMESASPALAFTMASIYILIT